MANYKKNWDVVIKLVAEGNEGSRELEILHFQFSSSKLWTCKKEQEESRTLWAIAQE